MTRKCLSKYHPKSTGWDVIGERINFRSDMTAKVVVDPDGNDMCLVVLFDCEAIKAHRFLKSFCGYRVSTIGGSVAYLVGDKSNVGYYA